MTGKLYQISAPHFCAGIVVQSGRIVEAAPILRWAMGRRFAGFEWYCGQKGWKVTHV